jgi:hypothetical protein
MKSFLNYLIETIDPIRRVGSNNQSKKKKPLVKPITRTEPMDRYEPRKEEKSVTYSKPKRK